MSTSVIEQICKTLQKYYKSRGKPYDKIFSNFCDENGLDDDILEEELTQSPADCLLTDFDENFPFKKEPKDKDAFIFNMIRKCKEHPNISFGDSIPTFDKDTFTLDDKFLEEVKEIYKEQCPVLWNSGMETDGGFLQVLAAGKKYNFDYLLHLVDDYSRCRVERLERKESGGYTEAEWTGNKTGNFTHRHFKTLNNINVRVPQAGAGSTSKPKMVISSAARLAEMAVNSFGKRCTPKLMFAAMALIDDDLETTVQFFNAAIEFISHLAQSKATTICPFQMDVCIAVGKPKSQDKAVSMGGDDEEDDDDDDDDDLDEKKGDDNKWVDCVGDIKGKLKKNKLKHTNVTVDLTKQRRLFADIYEGYLKENKLESEKKSKGYLYEKRLVTFIDRRKKGVNSDVWMYEPPANCRNIPKDAVPEWYISSSRTCLLPNMDYGDGSAATAADKIDKKENDNASKLKDSNIGSSFHCKGGLLTFSFHVKQADVIKCYLYYNGQVIRFMAEDIKTVLPRIFNMNYGQNRAYIENEVPEKDLPGTIKAMQEKLVDKEFAAFRQSYL